MRSGSTRRELEAGDLFGTYRIDERLGEGSMGSVYSASRDGAPARLALKVIRAEFVEDDQYRRRFLHEARAAAEVTHPHLVQVIDAGEIDGRQYLAMPLVDGESLDRRIAAAGPMGAPAVARLAGEIGGALDALHAVGLCHRDIKASNILVDRDGAAALTDFGLAKGSDYVALTSAGQILGTMEYLAPERIRGEDATPASDIYALGCVLFECLAGSTPFGGRSTMGVLFGHLEEAAPDLDAQRSDLPGGFGAALAAALAKDAAQRPPSAGAYARSLQDAVTVAGG